MNFSMNIINKNNKSRLFWFRVLLVSVVCSIALSADLIMICLKG